jgi:hypothetical protein
MGRKRLLNICEAVKNWTEGDKRAHRILLVMSLEKRFED